MKKFFILILILTPGWCFGTANTPTPTLGINELWYATPDFTPTPIFTKTPTLTATPTFTGTNGGTPNLTLTATPTLTKTLTRTFTPSYTPTKQSTVLTLGNYSAHRIQVITLPTPQVTNVPLVAKVGQFHAWWGRIGYYKGPNRRDAQLESIVVLANGPSTVSNAGTTYILAANQILVACGQRLYYPQPHVGPLWIQQQGFYAGSDPQIGKKSQLLFVANLPTYTATMTPTRTPTNTCTPTATSTFTNTRTATVATSWTPVGGNQYTPTVTPTLTSTPTGSFTPTPTFTKTSTPTPTPTSTPTITPTPFN